MSKIVLCGFKPVQRLEEYFRQSVLLKGEKLYDAGHVYDVKETDGVVVSARCHSQQGKQLYVVSLRVSTARFHFNPKANICRFFAPW